MFLKASECNQNWGQNPEAGITERYIRQLLLPLGTGQSVRQVVPLKYKPDHVIPLVHTFP